MKIISLNIWDLPLAFVQHRKERIARITDFLTGTGADVICLQESFDPHHRMALHRFFAARSYYATDLSIGSRNVFFKKVDTTGGLVTFSKFPILASAFIAFPRSLFSIREHMARKGMLSAVMDTPQGKLRCVNTHLHHKGFFDGEKVRLSQMNYMFAEIDKRESLSTIISGDFNQDDMHSNEIFSKLIAHYKFAHPASAVLHPSYRKENPYARLWINKISRSKRLDYILHSDLSPLHMKAGRYEVMHTDAPLSDHDPVMLEIIPA